MKLYNTLSRAKEDFVPLKAKTATIYSCGPTVYQYAHIGNLRTYIFMDLLRRGLKLSGFKLKTVVNITDVGHLLSDGDEGEDKMEVAAKKAQKTPWEIAEYFTKVFLFDCERLNINKVEIYAKATDYIPEMIDYVAALIDKGYGYETSDGIYFDISKFKDYGKLSKIKLDEQQAGARVSVNTEKRNPADFALWKKAEKNHIMQWQSPWGMGYPGWHIECSSLCKKFFGTKLDIHTGGVDHIPVHHENEIAQSEAREGVKTVNYWLHGAFMLVNGGKMSKSLGNAYTVQNLIDKGYSPLAFRYFCLNAHYRKELNFTFEGMDAAKVSLERLHAALLKHKAAAKIKASAKKISSYKLEFETAVKDDLNIPMALGTLWTMLKETPSIDIYNLALEFDSVFGLDLAKVVDLKKENVKAIKLPKAVLDLAELRVKARADKNWAESDRLRDEIAKLGYTIKDVPNGYTVEKV